MDVDVEDHVSPSNAGSVSVGAEAGHQTTVGEGPSHESLWAQKRDELKRALEKQPEDITSTNDYDAYGVLCSTLHNILDDNDGKHKRTKHS